MVALFLGAENCRNAESRQHPPSLEIRGEKFASFETPAASLLHQGAIVAFVDKLSLAFTSNAR
jgi:hypothetical protein